MTAGSARVGKAIRPAFLKAQLRAQMDESLALIFATLSDIASEFEDRRVRESALRGRIRTFDVYQRVIAIDDPRAAYVMGWASAVWLRQGLTLAHDKEGLGPGRPRMMAVAREIEEGFVALGRRHFPPETIEAAKDEIEGLARRVIWASQPGSGMDSTSAAWKSDLAQILKLPLAPITNVGKVASTPEAIRDFANVTTDLAQIVQHIPERTRWQCELLLLEMESTGPTAAVLKEMERLDQTLRDMEATVKALPASTGAEFEKSLAATEKAQQGLRTTLTEANAAAERIRIVVETAGETTRHAGEVGVKFTQAAKALESAAGAVRLVLAEFQEIQRARGPNAPEVPNPEELRELAEAATEAAREIRSVLSELKQPMGRQATLRQTAAEVRGLADTVFWRCLTLLTSAFVLALAYRWAHVRLPAKR